MHSSIQQAGQNVNRAIESVPEQVQRAQLFEQQKQLGAARIVHERLQAEMLEQKIGFYNQELDLRAKKVAVESAEAQHRMQLEEIDRQRKRDPYFQQLTRGQLPMMQRDGKTMVGRYQGGQLLWEEASPDFLQYAQRSRTQQGPAKDPSAVAWDDAQEAIRALGSQGVQMLPQQVRDELQRRVTGGVFFNRFRQLGLPDSKYQQYRQQGRTDDEIEAVLRKWLREQQGN